MEFSHLPAQAVHVKLAASKPLNGNDYDIEDLHKLQDLVEGKELKTHFLNYEPNVPRGIYEVILYDENSKPINLNFQADLTELQAKERFVYLPILYYFHYFNPNFLIRIII